MAIPTPDQIDAAVPVDGIPSRALVNAALKDIVVLAQYMPDDGTIPLRSTENENFSGGRIKAAPATDPEDCVIMAQLVSASPTQDEVDAIENAIVRSTIVPMSSDADGEANTIVFTESAMYIKVNDTLWRSVPLMEF